MDAPSEKWLAVPGFEGFYEVSNLGRIRSLGRNETVGVSSRHRTEKPIKADSGRVRLSRNGIYKNFAIVGLVHSLFPEATETEFNRPGEVWVPIRGYEGIYEVSNLYRVRRLARVTAHGGGRGNRSISAKILEPHRNNGYLVVHLFGVGGRAPKKFYVEAEVEHLFPDAKPEIVDDISEPGEEWRSVVGYEGLYEISNIGRVKSVGWYVNGIKRRYVRPRIRVPGSMSSGYLKVELAKEGDVKCISVHRLVAIAFIPNPLNLPVVHHRDETKLNNRADNLEWTTSEGNIQDWFDRRRVVVSADTIATIGAALAAGKTPAEILASLPRKRKSKR